MKEIIHYGFQETKLGLVVMAASDKGICLVEFGDDRPALTERLNHEFPEAQLEPSDATNRPEMGTWLSALSQYLDGGSALPDLPLDIRGTDFERSVWSTLRTIPAGQVLGYSQLADKIGRPSAARAAASACGRNRIAVLVPCHRVLRGDGQLGGYRWGLGRKQVLLNVESGQSSGKLATATAS